MTQTPGDLWVRLRRPLLDRASRFAWAEPILRDLRLTVDGRDQPLEQLFSRILYNDSEGHVLALGFGESPTSRAACDILVKLERTEAAIRLEIALTGKPPKELALASDLLASHPGSTDGSPGTVQGPFPCVAVRHLALP